MAQFANLLDGTSLRLMGGAALRYQFIDHIGDLQEALPHVRLIGESLVQTLCFIC